MDREAEITAKFWKALRSDMTVMLGVNHAEHALMRPMTAQFDGDEDAGPLWFFTSTENDIVEALGREQASSHFAFAAKGHDLFAQVEGRLRADHDRAVIDRLWNRFIAAWFPGGKDDPKLVLLRFDPDTAEIWLNESSIFAGIKLLLGMDPKKEYADDKAEVRLR